MKKFEGVVIGLRGKRGSGKDFVTTNVITKLYPFAKTYAYADRLRTIVHEQYGVDYELMTTPALKEMPLARYPVRPGDPLAHIICDFFNEKFARVDGNPYWTPRMLLIAEGQFKRAINPNYWADFVHQRVLEENPRLAVITDARFPEGELKGLRGLGGKLVQITRSLEKRGLAAELDDPSETLADQWTDWDDTWDNNGSAYDLRDRVQPVIDRWMGFK